MKPTPRSRIDVAVVEVEARREALALPLVPAPQPEEPLDPHGELRGGAIGEPRQQLLEHLDRRVLVADRGVLDRLEQVVRHEVGLVGLRHAVGAARPELGGRLLGIDHGERG